MLTIFAVPKPFTGPIAQLQDNALRSWRGLGEDVEVLLLGDDTGVAEAARAHGFRHLPQVTCNAHGTPLVSSIFELAARHARFEILVYVNADIILLGDFLAAVKHASRLRRFLMIGQRTDLDVTERLDVGDAACAGQILARAAEHGKIHARSGIDYFTFRKGLWNTIPPFALGRTAWDNWLVYGARVRGAAVIDATEATRVIHQNHDYGHVAASSGSAWTGAEAQLNKQLAGAPERLMDINDATWRLTPLGDLVPVLDWPRIQRRLQVAPLLHSWLRPVRRPLHLGIAGVDRIVRWIAPAAGGQGKAPGRGHRG